MWKSVYLPIKNSRINIRSELMASLSNKDTLVAYYSTGIYKGSSYDYDSTELVMFNEYGDTLLYDTNMYYMYNIWVDGVPKVIGGNNLDDSSWVFTAPGYTLEHVYPTNRVFTYSKDGPTMYVYLRQDNNTIYIHDTDHQQAKTVTINFEAQMQGPLLEHISQYLFNADDEYEFCITYQKAVGKQTQKHYVIFKEDGTTKLFHEVGFTGIEFMNSPEGVQPYVALKNTADSTTRLYRYDTLGKPAHIYNSSSLMRNKFTTRGEMFYFYDLSNKKAVLHNKDHQLVKEVEMKLPPFATLNYINNVTEDVYNKDKLLEFMYKYTYLDGVTEIRIMNESGEILFTAEDAGYSYFYYMGDSYIFTIAHNTEHKISIYSPSYPSAIEPGQAVQSATSLLLYPNPASDQIYVKHAAPGPISAWYQIYSLTGKHCQSGITLPTGQVEISALPPGAYIMQIHNAGKVMQEKFVKR
ncbi:MAG: T9SS type A sorting domain-containing protein [Bacteroidales bacterium]|nr:T9SS type A sorting domain-containing protein [Bacteroidales bacterium]